MGQLSIIDHESAHSKLTGTGHADELLNREWPGHGGCDALALSRYPAVIGAAVRRVVSGQRFRSFADEWNLEVGRSILFSVKTTSIDIPRAPEKHVM